MSMKIQIKKLCDEAQVPQYATPGAAGFDLHAVENYWIAPGETALVKTGLSFAIPEGYELQVRPRSGLSLKTPLRVANSPGTIDSDYRGEVCVIMTNTASPNPEGELSPLSEQIKMGDRIAQGVICPIIQAEFELTDALPETKRGKGGFGSTGQ